VNPLTSSVPLSPSTRGSLLSSLNDVISNDRAAGLAIAVARPWNVRAVSSSPEQQRETAAGSANAEITHGGSDSLRPTPAPSFGSATFRIEKSAESMKPVPSSNRTVSRCLPLVVTMMIFFLLVRCVPGRGGTRDDCGGA
jgi:hypothetical protein